MYLKRVTRAQVTLFAIVGAIILFTIALFVFIAHKDESLNQPPSQVPRLFIEQCIATAVSPSITAVLEYGGLAVPKHFIRRYDHPYNYLCFVDTFHESCYNYYPHLNLIAQEQIRADSVARVEQCFAFLIEDYESRGFDVTSEDLTYTVEIVPGSVRLRIDKPIDATKGGSVNSFREFGMTMPSDLYDLIAIARHIVNQEASHCYFESNGFMVLYPSYNLTRIDYLESKLYTVENRATKEAFKFAVRTCAYEPGIGIGAISPEVLGTITPIDDVRKQYDNDNDFGVYNDG